MTGVVGSSVNFNWTFSGSIAFVQWGPKKSGAFEFTDSLVTIDKFSTVITTEKPPYSGRMSGFWDGKSPGQATFTLNSTQKDDERVYMCKIAEGGLDGQNNFDTVKLLLLGKNILLV